MRGMEIKNIVHEHPLTFCEDKRPSTFCESNHCGQFLCHGCGDPCFGEFYYCELCCPQSPLFHQSCVDLQEDICITYYRPHCLLHFQRESSESKELDCDFCEQTHGEFKYSCGDCDFQIGVGCASKLVRYHQGQQHIEYFNHRHPLTLLKKHQDDDMNCDLCLKGIDDGPGYGCAPCKFYIHNSCRELPQEISHPFHPLHSLELSSTEGGHHCDACRFKIQGWSYQCNNPRRRCKFFLHPECTSLEPNIKYEGHPHLLILVENLSYQSKCKACGSNIQGAPFKRCVECRLDFHVECDPQPQPPTILACADNERNSHESRERIQHFSHEHELNIISESEVADLNCKLCEKDIGSRCYGCVGCEFYIHISCAELPHEIRHQFHPRHSLKLLDVDEDVDEDSSEDLYEDVDEEHGLGYCNACCLSIHGFRYRCNECGFNLHHGCTSMKADIVYKGHEHLLFLVENMSYDGECEACGLRTKGAFFMRCGECDLNFHVQCGPHALPQTIWVEQHGHGRLTLRTETHVEDKSDKPYCIICNAERNPEHPTYFFGYSVSYAHVRCIITKVQVGETKKIRHFGHQHSLFLLENESYSDDIFCKVCEKDIQAGPAYGCGECKFYLHESCAEVPRKIQHPFHRHSLCFDYRIGKNLECNACHKLYKGFGYLCELEDCRSFNLDLDCSLLVPSIKLEPVHHHTLTWFKQLYDDTPECRGCEIIPPNRDTSLDLDSWYLRCVKCNFNRHLLCCPLPKTILLVDIHHHRLTLTDNCIELSKHCYRDEYYCDCCETKRDGEECVYHCEKCNFVVDIECMFFEVRQFLEGKRKDVDWRIISRQIPSTRRVPTYKEMVKSLTEEDKKSLTELEQNLMEGCQMDVFGELRMKAPKQLVNETITEASSEELSHEEPMESALPEESSDEESSDEESSDEESTELTRLSDRYLFDEETMKLTVTDLVKGITQLEDEDELVNVEAYTISRTFAPLLKSLLDKYGDFGVRCRLTKNLKTMLLPMLCMVVQQMSNTSLTEIKDESIVWWWFLLKLFERAGFKVDFALDHIKRTAAVALFLRENEELYVDSPFYDLHKKIEKLSEEINERKANIENLRKQAQDTLSKYDSQQMKSKAKSINLALGFKWKKAAIGLFNDHQIL